MAFVNYLLVPGGGGGGGASGVVEVCVGGTGHACPGVAATFLKEALCGASDSVGCWEVAGANEVT